MPCSMGRWSWDWSSRETRHRTVPTTVASCGKFWVKPRLVVGRARISNARNLRLGVRGLAKRGRQDDDGPSREDHAMTAKLHAACLRSAGRRAELSRRRGARPLLHHPRRRRLLAPRQRYRRDVDLRPKLGGWACESVADDALALKAGGRSPDRENRGAARQARQGRSEPEARQAPARSRCRRSPLRSDFPDGRSTR